MVFNTDASFSNSSGVSSERTTTSAPTPDQRQAFRNCASEESLREYLGVLATDYDDWETFESVGEITLEG
jgi:hypothetical protein